MKLNKVLEVFQTDQQKLLKLLEDEDIEGIEELLLEEEFQIDQPLSMIYPITALDYAASMVSLFFLFLLREIKFTNFREVKNIVLRED